MIGAERERYRSWGFETPLVPWGIHPELLAIAPDRREAELVRLVFPGGFIGHRKPLEPVVEAFARTSNPNLRLLVKAQVERDRLDEVGRMIDADERIELRLGDQEWEPHLQTIAACDVCITPSRWEGLGLPLYEAMAFGQPVITNDDPPMNEVITDGRNGLLVASLADGTARSGIPAKRPDPAALTAAIERIADPELRSRLAAGARERRDELDWGTHRRGARGAAELSARGQGRAAQSSGRIGGRGDRGTVDRRLQCPTRAWRIRVRIGSVRAA